jgi:ribosome-associated heat shock protein Hsp15
LLWQWAPKTELGLGDFAVADSIPLRMSEERVRLDKWLWAARFYKTRALASEEISRGRVSINEQPVKASREPKVGDRVGFRQGHVARTVVVLGLSNVRGPAEQAQALYSETAESIEARLKVAEARRQGVEPSQTIEHGRPTKRDRRTLADWQRWSASADDIDSGRD